MFTWSESDQSFVKYIDGELAYRLHYTIIEKNDQQVMVIDHIMTNPAAKEDLTEQLIITALDFAKSHNYKVWPLGPTIHAYAQEHPDKNLYI